MMDGNPLFNSVAPLRNVGALVELIDRHANRLPLKHLGGLVGRRLRLGSRASCYRS